MCDALSGCSVPVHAVVKEEELTDVAAEKMLGLEDFQKSYFCGELFQDPERKFYEFLGSKPIFTLGGLGRALLNPFKFRRELKEMGERQKAKGIEGNMQGDGLTKGGILVISPQDQILYTFYEDPGNGVPSAECAAIVAAINSIEQPAAA